jgi:hypothetical protein
LREFSEVYFNGGHSLALVYQGMHCGVLCGGWKWVVLGREKGRWQVLPWVTSEAVS